MTGDEGKSAVKGEATCYCRSVLVDVLVHHWPTRTNGCKCGWNKLGASYPEHVADMYEARSAR